MENEEEVRASEELTEQSVNQQANVSAVPDDYGDDSSDESEELSLAERKKKIKIIASIAAPIISLFGFIILIFTVVGVVEDLFDLGNDDSQHIDSYPGFNSTHSNNDFWWPIGSRETTVVSGKTFATGTSGSTLITAYFNGNDSVHNGRHSGIDISAGINVENVIAVKDGKVTYPRADSNISIGTCDYYGTRANCDGYGNFVMIEHNDGTVTLYGHMYANSINVRAGDTVKQGQVIGKSGSSGNSTGGHLHFEIRIGSAVDPLEYVSPDNTRPGSSAVSRNNERNRGDMTE